mmetsp:Transcript_29846/g.41227  ORF Transcript_29846/g.41227 Transcript_29846/m.41227 type:complete len:152 (+) Transcript_29846:377-832(+)
MTDQQVDMMSHDLIQRIITFGESFQYSYVLFICESPKSYDGFFWIQSRFNFLLKTIHKESADFLRKRKAWGFTNFSSPMPFRGTLLFNHVFFSVHSFFPLRLLFCQNLCVKFEVRSEIVLTMTESEIQQLNTRIQQVQLLFILCFLVRNQK